MSRRPGCNRRPRPGDYFASAPTDPEDAGVNDPAERFTALYDRHYRSVLGYTLLRAGQDTAEDVTSETFLVAWRRLDDLPEPPLPWLLGVARKLLHKQYPPRPRRPARRAAEPSAQEVRPGPPPAGARRPYRRGDGTGRPGRS